MEKKAIPTARRADDFAYGAADVGRLGSNPAAFMSVRLVQTVQVAIPSADDNKGVSIGEYIDKFLVSAAAEGNEVQSFELEITPETWNGIADSDEVKKIKADVAAGRRPHG